MLVVVVEDVLVEVDVDVDVDDDVVVVVEGGTQEFPQ